MPNDEISVLRESYALLRLLQSIVTAIVISAEVFDISGGFLVLFELELTSSRIINQQYKEEFVIDIVSIILRHIVV